MELDYYQQTVNVRVLSRVEEQQKLENLKKIPEMLGCDGEYPADNPQGKFWYLC